MSLASTNMSIRIHWSIGVSEYSIDSKVIQYVMNIKLNKEVEYWSIRVQHMKVYIINNWSIIVQITDFWYLDGFAIICL